MNNHASGFSIIDVFSYLRNPHYTTPERRSLLSNAKYMLWSYIMCAIGILIAGCVILTIDYSIVTYLHIDSIYQQIRSTNTGVREAFGSYAFVVVVFVVPILEELIFRLPLDLRRGSIALGVTLLFFRFVNGGLLVADFSKFFYWLGVALSIFLFAVVYILLPKGFLSDIQTKYFKYWYYFIVLAFGLVHISNIKHIEFNYILFYPLFVMPQIIMSIFISNIRMKRGFVWGIALHALINGISFIL
ncbi:hypothetical protein HER32_12920 [Hymenobacter sp. BT18]|uniref:hypothetical protein n=1 Tax=Hymenobacter sp. BT18 TaxID=2835648 RepID=UPI00143E6984|nr:hypothetical protein [Hymenobacter sp. BT18]QIX62038.1 hypothetical protein HER32_12920 [Hymenobacter sp. BT18]